jgi:hypothetical protein
MFESHVNTASLRLWLDVLAMAVVNRGKWIYSHLGSA